MIFNAKSITIPEGSVVKITDPNGVVLWSKGSEPITTATPMYFENVDSASITIGVKKSNENAYTATLQTSTDGINWEYWGSTRTTALTKSVPVGDKLYVRASDNVGYFNDKDTYYNCFTSDGKVNVGGNIMSLGYKEFEDKTSITHIYAYRNVFYKMTKLVDTSKLVLPATTLSNYCYTYMFYGCTSLTKTPKELPAMTLTNGCYWSMFYNCTSLTKAPALPATSLGNQCYYYMFTGCTSLTKAPSLPATELVGGCYDSMFWNCSSLTTAPALPATTLAVSCYHQMFRDCTKLNKVTTYANDITAMGCLNNWLYNVSPNGDFYNLGTAEYPSGASGIPTGWTEHKNADI